MTSWWFSSVFVSARWRTPLRVFGAAFLVAVAACSGAATDPIGSGANGDGGSGSSGDDASATGDDAGGSSTRDGGGSSGDGGTSGKDSGTAHAACTTSFVGTALTGAYGRMDGHLVAVVPTNGSHACRADSGHVHLQVQMSGVVYDVAVNTDTYVAQKDIALPDGAWSEGWHKSVSLDYPSALGLHSQDFPTATPSALESKVEAALAGADQISIFATPYDMTGAHDVHRKSSGQDGAIFVNPTSAQAHVLAFRFSTDTF